MSELEDLHAALRALADEWTKMSGLPTPITFADLEKATPSERLLWEMADDLRTLLSEQPVPGVEPEAKRWRLRVAALNHATSLASVGRTEPADDTDWREQGSAYRRAMRRGWLAIRPGEDV